MKNEHGETLRKHWLAKCRYPGKEEFWFGAGSETTDATISEEQARSWLAERWATISPHPCPEFVSVCGGRIYIMLDKE